MDNNVNVLLLLEKWFFALSSCCLLVLAFSLPEEYSSVKSSINSVKVHQVSLDAYFFSKTSFIERKVDI